MVTKSLTVNELLRQHAGRFVETSTMYLLYDGCIQASSKSDKVLRLIAGREFSVNDAAIVIDPGQGFPEDDLLQTSEWAQHADILTMCLDCKSSFFANQRGHFTSFLVGQLPAYPNHVILAPFQTVRSMDYNHPNPQTLLSLFAPYIFPKRYLDEQLIQLARATGPSSMSYKNVFFGINYKGWRPTLNKGIPTLDSRSYTHRKAEDGGDIFATCVKPEFELRRNPIQPYVGDRILIDARTGAQYVLELKNTSKWDSSTASSFKEANLWHFMVLLNGYRTFIIRRDAKPGSVPVNGRDISKIPPGKHSMFIDFGQQGALEQFTAFIRKHGGESNRLVQEQDRTAIYHFTTVQSNIPLLDSAMPPGPSSGNFDFVNSFCNPLNRLCRRVETLFCWYLGPYNPIGDALVFDKCPWTEEELVDFDATGNHPSPLQSRDAKCIPVIHLDVNKVPKRKLRGVSDYRQSAAVDILSFSEQPRPACYRLGCVYVVGEVPTVQQGNTILISLSEEAGAKCELDCAICDNPTEIQWRGGHRGIVDRHQFRANSTYFRPFLLDHRKEESLQLHAYFMNVFDNNNPKYVKSFSDMLQTQLNHGPCSTMDRLSVPTLFFRRNIKENKDGSPLLEVVVDSPDPSDTESPSSAVEAATVPKVLSKNPSILLQKQHRERLETDSSYSTTAEEGFAYKGLMCDQCSVPAKCRIYADGKQSARHPSVRCGPCIAQILVNPNVSCRCTWDKQEQAARELAKIQQFRRWIPCNNCWNNKWICDKGDQCNNCITRQRSCVREQCELYDDSGEDCFVQNCQKAHATDGYPQTISQRDMPEEEKRSIFGGDGRAYSSRIPVCLHCWTQSWDALCDGGLTCSMCKITTSGDLPNGQDACTRRMCSSLDTCRSTTCNKVHTLDHGFPKIGEFPSDRKSCRVKKLQCPDLGSDQLQAIANAQLGIANSRNGFQIIQTQKVTLAFKTSKAQKVSKATNGDEDESITIDEMRGILAKSSKECKITKATLKKFLKAHHVRFKANNSRKTLKEKVVQCLADGDFQG